MKVKTNFKQMYLVDNVLYNKLNQHSTKPYLISSNVSQPPPTINFQPPPTFQPPTTIKDNVLQDNPQSFETKSEPPKQDTASSLKTTTEPHVPNKDILPFVSENLSNAKPFEIEEYRYLDDLEKEYKPYTQPAQQPTSKALEFNEPKQLAVSKQFDSSKQLLSQSTPAIQTNASQEVRPLALPQPMQYQQSLPALKQTEVMQVDDECKECDNIAPASALPPPRTYHALPPPPTYHALPPPPTYPTSTYPVLPFTYPAQPSPSNSKLALSTPQPALQSTYPHLPYHALPAPPTYPVLQSPFTYPALSSLTPSNSKLALPAPTSIANPSPQSTIPALPPPKTMPSLPPPKTQPALHPPTSLVTALPPPSKSMGKYEGYIKNKPVPVKMSYICTRCNTTFNKQSSLINHNKRFHAAFNQSVKGVKRLSKDEINHGETKVPKISSAKRKLKQNNGRFNKRRLTYDSYPQST